jgi:hypothetical protein
LWFRFEDELYPQYLQKTLGISTQRTAKKILEKVRVLVKKGENKARFSELNWPPPPNHSEQAGFTADWRKKSVKKNVKKSVNGIGSSDALLDLFKQL